MRSNKKRSRKTSLINTNIKKPLPTNNSNIDLLLPETDKKVSFEEDAPKVITSFKKRLSSSKKRPSTSKRKIIIHVGTSEKPKASIFEDTKNYTSAPVTPMSKKQLL
jgi:hypothetical protein